MICIWLNVIYVVIEAGFGFATDSMGLLSDAGHNLSDVASLILALIAYKASLHRPTDKYTYGFRRATVSASVINALILYAAVALILFESVRRLLHPDAVDGEVVSWVAGAGIIINGLTAMLLIKDSHHDLNVRGAFLHMAADTLVSVGVVVSGIVISLTGWYMIDPLIGIVIAILIAVTSLSMLKSSLRLALDGVPENIDINKVKDAVRDTSGVSSYHHLHIWALSTTESAMTVHVIVNDTRDIDKVIKAVRDAVEPLGITHVTVEAESSATTCGCNDTICW